MIKNRLNANQSALEVIFDLDDLSLVEEEKPQTSQQIHPHPPNLSPVNDRRKSTSPHRPPPPFASSFSNSIFSSLRPKSLPSFDNGPLRVLTQVSTIPEGSEAPDATFDSNVVDDTAELVSDDEEESPPPQDMLDSQKNNDLGPLSLPIPTNPAWEGFSKLRRPSHRLGTIQEKDEFITFPEYALASTAPSARTFQERAVEILRLASRPESKPRSQKSIRRKIYDEVDRQRHVDPGPEPSGDDGSETDTDTESAPRDPRELANS